MATTTDRLIEYLEYRATFTMESCGRYIWRPFTENSFGVDMTTRSVGTVCPGLVASYLGLTSIPVTWWDHS